MTTSKRFDYCSKQPAHQRPTIPQVRDWTIIANDLFYNPNRNLKDF